MKEAEDKNALFSFRLTLCLSPLHLDLFKLRPPRVGEKEDDDQPKNQSSNSPALGQTSSDGPLARMDDQDISARKGCHQSRMLNSHATSSRQDTKARQACFYKTADA